MTVAAVNCRGWQNHASAPPPTQTAVDRPDLHGLQKRSRPRADAIPIERPRVHEQERHRDQEPEVADSVRDERFLAAAALASSEYQNPDSR